MGASSGQQGAQQPQKGPGVAEMVTLLSDQNSILATISDQLTGLAEMVGKLGAQLAEQSAAPAGAPGPVAGSGASGRGGITDNAFAAVRVEPEKKAGKLYWKVFAGEGMMFGKFGLRIWPEVMVAAGLDPDTEQVYDLGPGWTAKFVNRRDDPEKADKVVELTGPAGGPTDEDPPF